MRGESEEVRALRAALRREQGVRAQAHGYAREAAHARKNLRDAIRLGIGYALADPDLQVEPTINQVLRDLERDK